MVNSGDPQPPTLWGARVGSHRVNKARTLAFLRRYGLYVIHAVSHKIGPAEFIIPSRRH
jgi:hypothetical protein